MKNHIALLGMPMMMTEKDIIRKNADATVQAAVKAVTVVENRPVAINIINILEIKAIAEVTAIAVIEATAEVIATANLGHVLDRATLIVQSIDIVESKNITYVTKLNF